MVTVVGMSKCEAIEDGGPYLQLDDLAVDVTRHHPFTEQLAATRVGFDEIAPATASPLLPDVPSNRLVMVRQN